MSSDSAVTPQEPKASPQARWWAILLGLILVALGVVAARELWLLRDPSLGWSPWVAPALRSLSQDRLASWMKWAAIASVLVGLLLLIAALRPRHRTHRRVPAEGIALWTRNVDVARFTTATAKRLPGVDAAFTTVTRSAVDVRVTLSAAQPDGDSDRITEELREALRPLAGEVELRVQVTEPDPQEAPHEP